MRQLPADVYLLGFSLFAMGTAEFLLAGVLPAVAADLDVSLSSAGLLITAFALGVVLGGPPFAVLSLHWPAAPRWWRPKAFSRPASSSGFSAMSKFCW